MKTNDEINANPQAALTFQNSSSFASVRGALTVARDRQLSEPMWKEVWTLWFAHGKSDPNIA